jgi:DNA-3-methyladenine glycosylase I
MSDCELEGLILNPNLIRNRLKIFSARKNALASLELQEEFGSLNNYLWAFVDHKPKINHHKKPEDVPTRTKESIALSKSLKKRGMSFVGPTIMYAFMQAVGMVNDHLVDCRSYGFK